MNNSAPTPLGSLGARIRVEGLTRRFGTALAVDQIDLELAPGSFTALVGPSGCGKSTLLSLLAGLIDPDQGEVWIDGQDVSGVVAERRPVGLLLQKPLLFPHLNVEDNVAFGLRMHRVARRRARELAHDLLARVQLDGLGKRRVDELSGGQAQRVALARALALEPRLLLLDEPFSQLDPTLRQQMRTLVRELAAESKLTTLFVTHDLNEAVEVADEITVMLEGRIQGTGTPRSFYTRPPSLAVARFFKVTNEFHGDVREGVFYCRDIPTPLTFSTSFPDGPAVLVVRPEALGFASQLEPEQAGASDEELRLPAVPLGVRFAGSHSVMELTSSHGKRLEVHLSPQARTVSNEPVTLVASRGDWTVFPLERQ